MPIRVSGTTVNEGEISSDITIDFPRGLTAAQKNKIKDEAGELIVDHILGRVGAAQSPLSGGAWPALDKEYKKFKQAQGRSGKADLELNGDMLDDLEFERTPNGVKIQITGGEAPKADGHNNFSGKSQLTTRQFLPKAGQKFVGSVSSDIDSIIADEVALSRRIRKSDLADITTKRLLNAFIREEFPDVAVSQAKDAILVDDDLRGVFSDVLDLF